MSMFLDHVISFQIYTGSEHTHTYTPTKNNLHYSSGNHWDIVRTREIKEQVLWSRIPLAETEEQARWWTAKQ